METLRQDAGLNESRQIRRGARSCAECRRRKVRCVYGSESPDVCKRCIKYDITCIDPAQQAVDNGAEEKRTLRERVAKLEERLNALQDGNGDRTFPVEINHASDKPSNLATRDKKYDHDEPNMGSISQIAPLVAILRGSNLHLATNPQDFQLTEGLHSDLTGSGAPEEEFESSKTAQICEALRKSLPAYSELIHYLSNGGQWWAHWHQKTFGSTITVETLPEFAARVFASDSPIELGMLVSAFARHTDMDALRYMSVIDQVIIADDRYAGTLSGLILIAFHTKNYLDAGQPRRAFLCNRRGLNMCQLMNLHRNYTVSPQRSAIWWTLFQGDRFLSILLGVPYGIRNDQFPTTITASGGVVAEPFVIRMGLMIGKVVDHTQTHPSPPFSKVIDLDEELESLGSSKTQHWWDHTLPADPQAFTEFRARVVEHCVFLLTRMYLHLPFVLKPPSSHVYSNSRRTGLDCAGELIRRYHSLRTPINNEPVFDCKTLDFIGFMASVVLFVGTTQHDQFDSRAFSTDQALINDTIVLLEQLAEQQNSTMAGQCVRCLRGLVDIYTSEERAGEGSPSKLTIPYFGTLYFAPPKDRPKSSVNRISALHTTSPSNSPALGDHQSARISNNIPTIEYQGLYGIDQGTDWMADNVDWNSASVGSMMDLDQDWGWFPDSGWGN